jgi:UrcA family protein
MEMNGLNKATFAYAGLVGLFLGSGAAIAQAPLVVEAELPRAIVSYADLDVANPAGLAVLKSRVKSAAAKLCLHHGTQPLEERSDRARCYADAIASAAPQIARAVSGGTWFAGRRAIEVALRK